MAVDPLRAYICQTRNQGHSSRKAALWLVVWCKNYITKELKNLRPLTSGFSGALGHQASEALPSLIMSHYSPTEPSMHQTASASLVHNSSSTPKLKVVTRSEGSSYPSAAPERSEDV